MHKLVPHTAFVSHLVGGCACRHGGIRLKPVAEDIKEQQTQEGHVHPGVEHAQHAQQAGSGQPVDRPMNTSQAGSLVHPPHTLVSHTANAPVGNHVEDGTEGGLLVEEAGKATVELITHKAVGGGGARVWFLAVSYLRK